MSRGTEIAKTLHRDSIGLDSCLASVGDYSNLPAEPHFKEVLMPAMRDARDGKTVKVTDSFPTHLRYMVYTNSSTSSAIFLRKATHDPA